jgi:hypothetical protein
MRNFVELSASHDTAGPSIELQIRFSCDDFSGQGAAYFDARSLESAAEKLQAFPLSPMTPIIIEGGYFDPSQPAVLREKHLSLRFSAGDKSPIELRVGAGVPWDHKHGTRHWAEVIFLIDYVQLEALSKALSALINGEEASVEIDLQAFG